MPIDFEDCSNHLRRIILTGRLDIPGTAEIDVKFAGMSAAAEHRLVVDLTGVSFLASMGIRSLISNAKAQQQRGGRMVLFVGDNAPVTKTLEATGIDVLIPMFSNFSDAEKAALA
jgi:anti-anti-sigma factor